MSLPPLIGHRGAAGHAPENTLAGLRAAARLGVRAVEFDVRLSRDGVPVLFHDGTLARTTDGHGAVDDHDLAALKTLDAGGWFAPAFRGERIPTLSEALAVLADLGLAANVEIKAEADRAAETGRAVAASLARAGSGYPGRLLLSSFSPVALRAAAETVPGLDRALLVQTIPRDWQSQCHRIGCAALHVAGDRLTPDLAVAVTAAGLTLRCYTVNDRAAAVALFALGVSGVFSDWPDRLAGLGPPAGR